MMQVVGRTAGRRDDGGEDGRRRGGGLQEDGRRREVACRGAAALAARVRRTLAQIGRASCRERVCQYV